MTETQLLMVAKTLGMVQTQLTTGGPHNLGQVGSSIPSTAVSYLSAELCSRLSEPFHVTAQQFQPTTKQEREQVMGSITWQQMGFTQP